MGIGDAALDTIGELAIKVVPDTKGFGDQVGKSVGAQVQTASRIGLGAVTAVGGGLLALGTQLDGAYDQIRVQTGATGEALKGLQDDFGAVAQNVPNSLDEVSAAVASVNQKLGITGEPLQQLSQDFLDLSHITGEDMGAALDSTTDLFNKFGITGGEATGVLQNLFDASQASGTSVADLATQVAKFQPVTDAFGISMKDTTALIGLLNKSGIDATKALPGFTKVLKDAGEAGEDPKAALRDLFESIKLAPDATEAAQRALENFGPKVGPQLASAIREGGLSLDDLWKQLGAGSDTIGDVADETADAAETFKELKNKLAIALGPSANRLFSSFGKAAENAAPAVLMVVDAIVPLIDAISKVPAPILAGVVGLLAVGSVAGKIAKPIQALSSTMSLLAANPWVLVVAGLVAAGILIYKNWDKIKKAFANGYKAVSKVVSSIGDTLEGFYKDTVGVFDDVVDAVGGFLDDVGGFMEGAGEKIAKPFQKAWDTIQTIVDTVTLNVGQIIDTWTGRIQTAFDAMKLAVEFAWDHTWGFVLDKIVAIVPQVLAVLQSIIDFLYGPISTALAAVQTGFQVVWSAVSSAVQTAWDAMQGPLNFMKDAIGKVQGAIQILQIIGTIAINLLKGAIGTAVDFIIGKLDQLKNKLQDMLGPLGDVAGKIGSVAGKLGGGIASTTKKVIGYDSGGTVPGPVGAPQLAVVHGGEEVLTPEQQRQRASGAGWTKIVNLNLNGPITLDSHERVLDLRRTIYDQERSEAIASGQVNVA